MRYWWSKAVADHAQCVLSAESNPTHRTERDEWKHPGVILMSEERMGRASRPTTMTGAAGVHLLAGLLSAMNLPVAIAQKNVPNVDLFVGTLNGSSLAIQVKTMRWARREKKRKRTVHYEWRCSRTKLAKGLYTFIDLKQGLNERHLSSLPEVFFVPVGVVKRWKRFPPNFVKPTERDLAPYRDNWGLLKKMLASG